MTRLLIMLLVMAPALTQIASADERPADDRVTYRFENERFLISRIELEIDAAGAGRLVFTRRGIANPVERPVRVGDAAVRRVFGLFDKLDFVKSAEVYQKGDHANLGTVTIALSRAGAAREVQFNYTDNRDMDAIAKTLRGIATREIYAFDLETASRFQPLDTPRLLQSLGDEIRVGTIADAGQLLPLLRRIIDDVAIPLISRNRARDLVTKIEAAESE